MCPAQPRPGTGRPLRVLVVHNRYRSETPSGEDRVVDDEVELLAAAGHDVELFERRSDDIAGMSLPERAMVPVLVPWNPRARADLRARLNAARPDVVHVHCTFPLLSPSVVSACTDTGVPAVATLHNYQQICPTGTLYRDGGACTDCVGRLPFAAVRHGCYRNSRAASIPMALNLAVNRRRWWSGVERFFCISEAQRRVLVGAGMPADKLVVKHHGVTDSVDRRSGPGEHVLFVGRISVEKGVRMLMQAWDRVTASGGLGVPLLLAGSGPLDDEVRRWAGDRADVRLLGLQSAAECRRLAARSTAVVVPSTWMEAFGLVAVEAMAAGVPVVAAGHGALVELVADGETGLLHRPGDAGSLAEALRAVAADPDRNARLGRAARRRYEAMFSPAAGLDALLAGYRGVLAG